MESVGDVEYRAPQFPHFYKLKNGQYLADGGALRLSGPKEAAVTLKHRNGDQFEFKGEQILTLNYKQLLGTSESFRQVVSDIVMPSERSDKAERGITQFERLISYISPEDVKKLPRDAEEVKEKWTKNPIPLVYPGPVHLIQTEFFPVTATLEWSVQGLQEEPHKVFVWSEEQMSFSPYIVASGGKATIQFSSYGKYYWQIEDGSGKFVSVPRTILVRPKEKDVAKTEETEQESKEVQKLKIKPVKMLSPISNTLFYACFSKNNKVTLPISIVHEHLEVSEYKVQVNDTERAGTQLFTKPNFDHVSYQLPVSGPTSFQIRVMGYGKDSTKKDATEPTLLAMSELIPVRVEKLCGIKSNPAVLAKLFDFQKTGTFADTGATVVLTDD